MKLAVKGGGLRDQLDQASASILLNWRKPWGAMGVAIRHASQALKGLRIVRPSIV